ncbi:hypothetical protein VTL71DRAFT_2936 [Oculimacula yallundae]|uniref:Uncharacterized protein n=1 Tax=Oculimacula yallundae TaxID=86028 RepID=A0ABR4C6Y1_9HELO
MVDKVRKRKAERASPPDDWFGDERVEGRRGSGRKRGDNESSGVSKRVKIWDRNGDSAVRTEGRSSARLNDNSSSSNKNPSLHPRRYDTRSPSTTATATARSNNPALPAEHSFTHEAPRTQAEEDSATTTRTQKRPTNKPAQSITQSYSKAFCNIFRRIDRISTRRHIIKTPIDACDQDPDPDELVEPRADMQMSLLQLSLFFGDVHALNIGIERLFGRTPAPVDVLVRRLRDVCDDVVNCCGGLLRFQADYERMFRMVFGGVDALKSLAQSMERDAEWTREKMLAAAAVFRLYYP